MNHQLIQSLIENATTYGTWEARGYKNYPMFDRYKFCEVVVKECIESIVRTGILEQEENWSLYVNSIKERFGYEAI